MLQLEFHNFSFIVVSLAYNCSHHWRDSFDFLVCCREAKWCEGSLYNIYGCGVGENNINLYLGISSFGFLIIGKPAIPCSSF